MSGMGERGKAPTPREEKPQELVRLTVKSPDGSVKSLVGAFVATEVAAVLAGGTIILSGRTVQE